MGSEQLNLVAGAAVRHPGKGERIAGDRYYTEDPLASAIIGELGYFLSGNIWEPHAGGGAFTRPLLQLAARRKLIISDLDPEAAAYDTTDPWAVIWRGVDFLGATAEDIAQTYKPQWIIGNPPYQDVEAHIRRAVWLTRQHVVFLLPSTILHSAGRIRLYRECGNPRHIWHLAQRPSFTGKGTDPRNYVLVWWDKAHLGETTSTPCWDWRGDR
ncbi:MAG: hypothetical protein AAFR76_01560 [Planctomycetota bacterium]